MATPRKTSAKKAHAVPPVASAPSPSQTRFDYDAVETTGRRKAPRTRVVAEHVVLPDSKRVKMLATVQDQIRNASVAAWMVRRHLDYVSRFRLQFRTGDDSLDQLVTRIFDWHGKPRNFDVAGRLGREEMFRLFEMEKVTSGDGAIVKLSTGKLQAVESDLIAYPKSGPRIGGRKGQYNQIPRDVIDRVGMDTGVVISDTYPGLIEQFCLCNRGWDGKAIAFDHLEDAANVIFDAYWTRFSSQVRGVSPLSTAINSLQDVYEGVDWNLAKAKAHALFGIALMRDYAGGATDQEEVSQLGAVSGVTVGYDEAAADGTAYESDAGTKSVSSTLQEIKPNSMMLIDMESKGRIDTIESKTPSQEFQAFTELVMRLVLISLDIPFSAFDSRTCSFAGMIADNNLYEVSCGWKRDKNKWARQDYSDWLLERIWNDTADEWGLRAVAARAGKNRLRDIQEAVHWVPSGSPWLQKLNQVQGDIKAISVALDNPIDACKRNGGDVFENIDKIAQVNEYAKSKGVSLLVGESGQRSVEEVSAEASGTDETRDEQ